jgi:8-oxo-dGTP diphosphatase
MSHSLPDRRKLLLVAAIAMIDARGRVLLAQRPPGKSLAGLWEFPGGKVELGESPEQALVREVQEELDVIVAARALTPFAFASHAYEDFHLLMPLYVATQWDGAVTPREGQNLAWAGMDELESFAMPPADVPLVARLKDWHPS